MAGMAFGYGFSITREGVSVGIHERFVDLVFHSIISGSFVRSIKRTNRLTFDESPVSSRFAIHFCPTDVFTVYPPR